MLPGQRAAIPCGIAIELPHGYEAQVRPRSGLALNQGVTVLNAPGTIDSDYRGEVKAILINHGAEPFLIKRGAKIAQMVIARHEQAEIVESDALVGQRARRRRLRLDRHGGQDHDAAPFPQDACWRWKR